MLFFPAQQELDCINDNGDIIGKITFDGAQDEYVFSPVSESIVLSGLEEASIAMRLAGLKLGKFSIPMQDDD
ncbi:hypothetical protein [Oceanospirillum sediminis]|nr:hypothetical protein [Oceanospirillum sediminis]